MKKELSAGTIIILTLTLLVFWYAWQYAALTGPSFNENPSAAQNQSAADIKLDMAAVALHNKPSDCWIIISGNVYSVSRFLILHPGGAEQITPFCGKDATAAFRTKNGTGQHSSAAYTDLNSFLLGSIDSSVSQQQITDVTTNNPLPQISGGDDDGENDDD